MRLKVILGLALLLAQLGASAHQLDHLSDVYGERCFSCVLVKHLDHVAPPSAVAIPVFHAPGQPEFSFRPVQPTLAAVDRPRQRAPPSL